MFDEQVSNDIPFGKKTMRSLAALQKDVHKYSIFQVSVSRLDAHVQANLLQPQR